MSAHIGLLFKNFLDVAVLQLLVAFFHKPVGSLTLTKRFAICVPDEVYSVTAEMARSSMVSVPERAATGSRSTA